MEATKHTANRGANITIVDSSFASSTYPWRTASQYSCPVAFATTQFYSVADLLLTNPNLNSSHLFRADILRDSSHLLKTPTEVETDCGHVINRRNNTTRDDQSGELGEEADSDREGITSRPSHVDAANFRLDRTVLRELIPRNPRLDNPLYQTCHFYTRVDVNRPHQGSAPESIGQRSDDEERLVVYLPHSQTANDLPFYHPPVRGLAYGYSPPMKEREGVLSVHILPFDLCDVQNLPARYHRMFGSMLSTFARLGHGSPPEPGGARSPRDNIVPQHAVQNTYTRLKEQYAADLVERWVESTEPSKHVFEDLSIAAFLIELWRQMYRSEPRAEQQAGVNEAFPGFVDIACGNGVLVHVLIQEGYAGWGFDARRRKTWSIFTHEVQQCLQETVCIPRPFLDCDLDMDAGIPVHDGTFKPGTFVISNHADELTPWTPIMAALSDPQSPLPFLAIPCCSHAIDGLRHRYTPRKMVNAQQGSSGNATSDQPQQGDLRAMRQAKLQQSQADPSASTYASLTAHVFDLAKEVGYDVERTLMRIPSTRNIGLIGRTSQQDPGLTTGGDLPARTIDIVRRECEGRGGVESAARTWIARSMDLHKGTAKGMQH